MSEFDCCKAGFKWDGKPTGKEATLGNNKSYVTGDNKDVAILLIHDVFGVCDQFLSKQLGAIGQF